MHSVSHRLKQEDIEGNEDGATLKERHGRAREGVVNRRQSGKMSCR